MSGAGEPQAKLGWLLLLALLALPAQLRGLDPRLAAINDWLYVLQPETPAAPADVARYNDYHGLARAQGYLSYAAWIDRDLNEILTVEPTGGFTFGQPVPGPALFIDGFESGDTTAWTATLP